MSIYNNNESDFIGPLETPDVLYDLSIRIDPQWVMDGEGRIHLDLESMMSEFQTHAQGLEIICEEYNEKKFGW